MANMFWVSCIPWMSENDARNCLHRVGAEHGWSGSAVYVDWDDLTGTKAPAQAAPDDLMEQVLQWPLEKRKELYKLLYNQGVRINY